MSSYKNCGSCRHYKKEFETIPYECTNYNVIEMVDADAGFVFCPPVNFGCVLFAAKENVIESRFGSFSELDIKDDANTLSNEPVQIYKGGI